MESEIESLEDRAKQYDGPDMPPLHLWDPPLSGDIDIVITADGVWHHEGEVIAREALVRLFASILRREEDGKYYLVTPVEKWRIKVELHPLIVTDIDPVEHDGRRLLLATLNTGRQSLVKDCNDWFMEPSLGNVAAIRLPYGLTALFSRPAWYRLVDLAESRGDGLYVGDLKLQTS